ncbi:hypothetical protein QNN00_18570 [Bacillus velezensis]|nr:hypothetical protein [Bacillus velezensis]
MLQQAADYHDFVKWEKRRWKAKREKRISLIEKAAGRTSAGA